METESNGFVSGGDVSYVPTREPETKAARQARLVPRRNPSPVRLTDKRSYASLGGFGYCTSKLMNRFDLSLRPLPCIT